MSLINPTWCAHFFEPNIVCSVSEQVNNVNARSSMHPFISSYEQSRLDIDMK